MGNDYINTLDDTINRVIRFVYYFSITIGTLGALCNILTFTSKKLRRNTCGFYLLCSAIFDLVTLLFGSVTRLMIDHYSTLLPLKSSLFCKLRTYLATLTPGIATYFVVLCSIDRCLLISRSAYYRAWSNIKVAQKAVIIVIGFWFLSGIHVIVFFDVRVKSLNNSLVTCTPQNNIYRIFASVYFLACFLYIPCLIMIVCSILTSIYINNLKRRIGRLRFRKLTSGLIDRHLTTIMFVQVGLTLVFLSFRMVCRSYSLLTINESKDRHRLKIESFVIQLSFVLYTMNFSKSFIAYTLTSRLFRRIFWKRLKNGCKVLRNGAIGIFS